MQVYAWAGMLVSYSQEGGIVKAAKETFSGEKPCALCCRIAAAKKSEAEKPEPLAPVSGSQLAKLLQEIVPTSDAPLVFSLPAEIPPLPFAAARLPNGLGAVSPPTPPPRARA